MLVSGVRALFVLFILFGESTSSPIEKNGAVNLYNDKYPLTDPSIDALNRTKFRIAMVADLDSGSKFESCGKTMWRSYLKKGNLTYSRSENTIVIEWDTESPVILKTDMNENGRGMEASELVTFNNKLLTFDDRTGNIFDITNGVDPIKWIKLKVNDTADDSKAKGFKSEWATVKDGFLFTGSMGREWKSAEGIVENKNAMFVKKISTTGKVRTLDWTKIYEKLRRKSYNIKKKGYMTHESCMWSKENDIWVFLPRRCSREDYDEHKDGTKGCNLLIKADKKFQNIKTVTLDPKNHEPTHGFSSFKFIPNTNIIVALKTVELEGATVEIDGKTTKSEGQTETFIVAFDLEGHILYKEQLVSEDLKFEGFEFI